MDRMRFDRVENADAGLRIYACGIMLKTFGNTFWRQVRMMMMTMMMMMMVMMVQGVGLLGCVQVSGPKAFWCTGLPRCDFDSFTGPWAGWGSGTYGPAIVGFVLSWPPRPASCWKRLRREFNLPDLNCSCWLGLGSGANVQLR